MEQEVKKRKLKASRSIKGNTLIRSKKIKESARDERCTMQIPNVCVDWGNGHPTETTIYAHFPDESHGFGQKSDDISGGYSCSLCHDILDSRVPSPDWLDWKAEKDWYMRRSQTRTIRRLIQKFPEQFPLYKETQ